MIVKPLRKDLLAYLSRHGLTKKYTKQIKLLAVDFHYSSLHTEILESKSLKIYSFRIDRKYRAIFILIKKDTVEIIDLNDHYK